MKRTIGYRIMVFAVSIVIMLSFFAFPIDTVRAADEESPIYHIVKDGETIESISKMYGIEQKKLMEDNKIGEDALINTGDKLVISKTSAIKLNESEPQIIENPSKITLDVVGVDIRDALSSLAVSMGKSILFIDAPRYITFHIEDTAPLKVLELILAKEGLGYIQEGNVIIVGKTEDLHKNFFTQMVVTKFSLSYITAEKLSEQIDRLELPLKKMNVEGNPKAIWIQSTPQVVSKVREVVNALDVPENSNKDITIVPFKLNYLVAEKLAPIVTQLDINVNTIWVSTNQKTIWAQGSQEELKKFKKLIEQLDVADNKPEYKHVVQINMKYITPTQVEPIIEKLGMTIKIISMDENRQALWAMGTTQELEDLKNIIKQLDIIDNLAVDYFDSITQIKLNFISSDKVAPIITQSEVNVKVFTVANNPYSIWVMGKEVDIDIVNNLVSSLDVENNRSDLVVFALTLNNISAEQAIDGLNKFGYSNVKTIAISPKVSKSLLVICPEALESAVRGSLFNLDMEMNKIASNTTKLKVPVDYSNDQVTLTSRMQLISSLTGVGTGSFRISENVSRNGTDPYYVLWLEDTNANVKKVMDVIKLIDNPLDTESSSSSNP